MPQRYNESVQNTFVQGLITERGELTFPEDASTDELNCDLLKTGARRRRLGLAQESAGELSTETSGTGTVFSNHLWENVAEQEGIDFVVVQMGNLIWFYQQTTGSLSANRVDTTLVSGVEYSLDLETFRRPASTLGTSISPIQVASIKGALVVSSPELNTFYITRDPTTGAFTETAIDFRIRDYDWQGDITTYDTALATGSTPDARIYDTKNSGWSDGPGGVGDAALTTYTGSGSYPPLTHPWFSGKNASGVFSLAEWNKIYAGSTLLTNGHYVLDLYSKDRHTPSGIAGTALNTTEDSRFTTVAPYAGRVFYGGMSGSTDDNGSKVFFSQILEQGFTKIGDCFQSSDPTSEELSDLLDTDGGFISIPEAHNVKKIHNYGPDLYVFAENGVWRVSGVDDVFRATEYSVSKMGEDGLVTANSFVSASGRPYWWSNSGIFTIGVDQSTGQVITQNLSVSSVQSFWSSIGAEERSRVQASYDDVTRRVFWAYPDSGESLDNKLNKILIFDEVLNAFFPWAVSDQASDTDYMVGLSFTNGTGTTTITYNVVDSSGQQVIDSSLNPIVINREGQSLSSALLKVMYRDGSTGSVSFAEFSDTSFLDWGDANYESYAETAYSFLGSAINKKNVPYILTFMKTTETGWEQNATMDGYDALRPSSLTFSSKWDFRTNPNTAKQECYRLKYPASVDISDLSSWNYPETVVTSRLKVRGKGRVMTLRWESQQGKDFHLLGWSILGAANDRV